LRKARPAGERADRSGYNDPTDMLTTGGTREEVADTSITDAAIGSFLDSLKPIAPFMRPAAGDSVKRRTCGGGFSAAAHHRGGRRR